MMARIFTPNHSNQAIIADLIASGLNASPGLLIAKGGRTFKHRRVIFRDCDTPPVTSTPNSIEWIDDGGTVWHGSARENIVGVGV